LTNEDVAWSVVQVIVSDVDDTFVAVTADMTGAGNAVVNVAFAEVEDVLAALADTTTKS
jgi:hypothetical protein